MYSAGSIVTKLLHSEDRQTWANLPGSPEELRKVRSLHTKISYVNKPQEHSAHTSQVTLETKDCYFELWSVLTGMRT